MTDRTHEHHPARADFAAFGATTAILGESPVWSARARFVWWVDVEGRKLFRTDLAGATRAWDTPEPPGFVQLDAQERPVLGLQSGLFGFDPGSGRFDRLVRLDAPGVRCNDACTDSLDRMWVGTMDLENARANGVLHLIAPGGGPIPVLDGFRTINGLAWDAGLSRLYLSDSHAEVRTIWTLDCPEGQPRPESRRVFARLDGADGRPDGATIDRDGHYWIAGVGGGRLHRFAPDGTRAGTWDVPFAEPTKPAFVGDGLGQMVLTRKNGAPGLWNIRATLGITGVAGRTDAAQDQKEPTE